MAPLLQILTRSLPNNSNNGPSTSNNIPNSAIPHHTLSTAAAVAISVIAALILLLIGGFGIWWVLKEKRTNLREQREREDVEMKVREIEGRVDGERESDRESGWEVVVGSEQIEKR
jgi:hypothetical protein